MWRRARFTNWGEGKWPANSCDKSSASWLPTRKLMIVPQLVRIESRITGFSTFEYWFTRIKFNLYFLTSESACAKLMLIKF